MVALNKWVDSMLSASFENRTRMKKKVLDGIEYFNAKWRTKNPANGVAPTYALNRKDPAAQRLVKELSNRKDFQCMGFAPNISYVKINGSKKEMSAIWEHPFAHPALVYAHKHLPCIIIAGPNIMIDDSILNRIPENRHNVPTGGVSG